MSGESGRRGTAEPEARAQQPDGAGHGKRAAAGAGRAPKEPRQPKQPRQPKEPRGAKSRPEKAPKPEKAPRGTKQSREPKPPKAEKPARGRKAAAAAKAPLDPSEPRQLAVEARVDLLPPEVRSGRRNEAIAHRMILALVVVIVIVVMGIGGSTLLAVQSRAELQAAQSRTAALLSQEQKIGSVRQIQSQIQLVQAGQQVGASTEIDWTSFLGKVRATIGGGLTMTGISLDSASPLAAYAQSNAPLQGARVATVTINVTAANLDVLPPWLGQLATLPGVADVSPGTVTLVGSGYTASAIIHLDQTAYDNRFATKGK